MYNRLLAVVHTATWVADANAICHNRAYSTWDIDLAGTSARGWIMITYEGHLDVPVPAATDHLSIRTDQYSADISPNQMFADEEAEFATICLTYDAWSAPAQRDNTRPRATDEDAHKAAWIAGRRRWRRNVTITAARTALNTAHDNPQDRYIGPHAQERQAQHNTLSEFPMFAVGTGVDASTILTRATDPFQPKRVQAILDVIQLGDDLTEDEKMKVRELIMQYADCFALSVKEVLPIPGAVHRLNVPPGTTFSRKIHQRPLTPPQRKFVYKKIDELLEAGAIERARSGQVRCSHNACTQSTRRRRAIPRGTAAVGERAVRKSGATRFI